MVWRSPPAESGTPTTRRAGFHSETSFSICVKSDTAGRGCAVRSSGSPTATPMRFKPKSKASTVREELARAKRSARSGMSRFVLQPRVVEAEKLHRSRQPLFGRRVEDDRVARLDRQPRVLRQLVLELSGRPAGIAEGDEHALGAFAAPDRFEDVLRGGKAEDVAHAQRRLPVAHRRMQHEAPIG